MLSGKKTYIVSALVVLFILLKNIFGIEISSAQLDSTMDVILGVVSTAAATLRAAIAKVEKKID